MKIGVNKFQDLVVWQRSHQLTVEIFKATNNLDDHSFKDQIRRAAMSVGANISEGFHRESNKQFRYFLQIARGSVNEVLNFILLGKEIGYFDDTISLQEDCVYISRMLRRFILSLEVNKD
jgi:four helix bundle protein